MCSPKAYQRKLEPFYQLSPYIAEGWNTVSNLPFIIIGLLRLCQAYLPHDTRVLYTLMLYCGIGSALHHASGLRWTIVIDWIPISLSIFCNLYFGTWLQFSLVSLFKAALALGALALDHIWTPINVPYGHCVWHVLAALAMDACYQDLV